MMLARRDLLTAWENGKIRFDPDISRDQISLSSIDLRLGCIFTKQRAHKGLVIRPAQEFDPSDFVKNTTLGSGGIFRLRPKEFRLAQTLEKITLPAGLAAHIHGRSSLARSGLAVHST
jgi:dCTP deaminase